MRQYDSGQAMHYHRCSDAVWFAVRDLLTTLCTSYVNLRQSEVSVSFSRRHVEDLFVFVNEMDLAYIHPRSDSAKFIYVQETAAKRAEVSA